MRSICLLLSSFLIAMPALAQVPYLRAKNAVQLGADYLGIDPANGLKYRYALAYRRYAARDRLGLEAAVGFLRSQRETVLVPDLVSVGTNSRRRLTLELTATYRLFRYLHHELRLGAGPSAWYSRDDLFDKVEPYPIPGGAVPTVTRRQLEGWQLGAHALAEYSYSLSLNTQVGVHAGLALVGTSGLVPLVGFRAGYRF